MRQIEEAIHAQRQAETARRQLAAAGAAAAGARGGVSSQQVLQAAAAAASAPQPSDMESWVKAADAVRAAPPFLAAPSPGRALPLCPADVLTNRAPLHPVQVNAVLTSARWQFNLAVSKSAALQQLQQQQAQQQQQQQQQQQRRRGRRRRRRRRRRR